jgi:hypothetical protein
MNTKYLVLVCSGFVLTIGAVIFLIFSIFIQGSRILIEWNTASEINTLGFNIYRSTTLNGDRIQINEYVIPANADPLVGGYYIYTDENINPGRVYYYFLEEVDLNGNVLLNGPVEIQARLVSVNNIITVLVILLGILFVIFGLSRIIIKRKAFV